MTLPFNFDKAIEGLSKVTLKGGVVGKVTLSVIVVALSCALIAWSVRNVWLSAAALAVVCLISFTMLWRLISFADRHPQAALLEGAEFLVHQQIVHASKTTPVVALVETAPMQPEPVLGSAANPQIAQQPDEGAQPVIGGNQ